MDQKPARVNPEELYFAARSGKELGDAVFERKRVYERFVESSGLQRVWRRMHWRYYGADADTGKNNHQVDRDGPKGEISLLNMNHLRADVTLWLTLAFSQRSEMEPECDVGDYQAELEVRRAKAALAHFNTEAQVETAERMAGEFAGIYGMSFIMRWWNPNAGQLLMPPDEEAGTEAIYAGTMECHALTPMDTFLDPFSRRAAQDWLICRIFDNRWNLMARYPRFAEQIRGASHDEAKDNLNRVDLLNIARAGEGKGMRDEVPVYFFWHAKTPALPNGKLAIMLSPEVVLEEIELGAQYDRIPVQRLAAAEIHRTPFGYSPAWGLLAPQEAQVALSSIALTNAATFGLGVIVSPKGNDVDERTVAEGLTLINYTPGLEPPKALALPTTPQEVFAFRDALISEMGTLVGVNSVVRGDPEASLKSGSALALVQAQAVQFSNDFQANILVWKERHHFDTIVLVQLNMAEELTPSIAGDYTSTLLKSFSGKDIKRIKKIKVSSINPMARTLAGKVQMADTLAERWPDRINPGDYFRVIDTGSIDYLTRGDRQRRANLDRENELLAAGIGPKPPPLPGGIPQPVTPGARYVRALITDDHRAHVLKHLEVLDNPAIRESEDPEAQKVIDAVLSHIEEHEQLATMATLNRLTLLELTNQPPLQSVLPPPPVDGAAPDAGKGPPKKGGGGDAPPSAAMQPEPPGAAELPRQPEMPINPSTGQRAEEIPGPT